MHQAYDQRREEYFQSKGIQIIRFINNEVKNNIDEVIRRILFDCGVKWLFFHLKDHLAQTAKLVWARPDSACARQDTLTPQIK